MLHFSKVAKLEAKFDALEGHVACEISLLVNKLESLSSILSEKLKTLE